MAEPILEIDRLRVSYASRGRAVQAISEASLENVAGWPGDEPVDEVTAETREAAAPAIEESAFWGNGGARDFDWGD